MPDRTGQTLKEILDDPMTVAVMDRDGVNRDDLWKLMAALRDRRQPRPSQMAA